MRDDTTCPECGGALASGRVETTEWFANRHAHVEFWGDVCGKCGARVYAPADRAHARRKVIDEVRTVEGLLTPGEMRAIRRRLGLTQAQMERLLRVGENTVVRWERGTVFQSYPVDSLIRVLSEVPGAYAFLADLVGLHRQTRRRLY